MDAAQVHHQAKALTFEIGPQAELPGRIDDGRRLVERLQGAAGDPFGRPDEVRSALATAAASTARSPAHVVEVPGDHGPSRDLDRLVEAVGAFVDGLRWGPSEPTGAAREEPSRMTSTDA